MKKIYNSLFILIVMLISFIAIGKVDAMVADAIASGTSGDCEWRIDSDKTLVIGPDISDLSNGKTSCTLGEPEILPDLDQPTVSYFSPWLSYVDDINHIIVESGVVANTNSNALFKFLSNVKTVDVSNLDTTNVETMQEMFSFMSSLETINLGNFNTDNVNNMQEMFQGLQSLKQLDLSSFNTSGVINMALMFNGCQALKELDLTSFDTSNVTNMDFMLSNCDNLQTIYASEKFITNKVTDSEEMFSDDTSLVGGNGTKYDSNKTDASYAVIDSNNTPGYFTKKLNTYIVSFNTNGGTSINNQRVLEGEKVSSFKTTRDGYKFVGWYKDSEFTNEFDFNTPITSNLTLYSKWQKLINISDTKITGITNKTYNRKYQTQNLKITYNGKILVKDVDYSVAYKNNLNPGVAYVIVTGKEVYYGKSTISFYINPAKISSAVLSSTVYSYNGYIKSPSVTVKDQYGNLLVKNRDYTVTYQSGRKHVGTYKVVIKGKGNYTGTITKTFKINPPTTYIKSFNRGKAYFKVIWNKKPYQVTGYQIKYSTSSKMTSPKYYTLKGYKTTSKTVKYLKRHKVYYVQVRTYKKTVSGTYYSTWSKVKRVVTL